MKHRTRRILLSGLLICAVIGSVILRTATAAGGADLALPGSAAFAPDELLVKFRPSASPGRIQRALAAADALVMDRIPGIDVYVVHIPDAKLLPAKLESFRNNSSVAFAEPNFMLTLAGAPNDTYYSYQWAFKNTGQPIGPSSFNLPAGTPGADIRAEEAWDIFHGSGSTIAAIVDTGVDITHPELVDHILSPGFDFVNNDFEAKDDHGHGTHLAGIIGALTNNGAGVAGMNWDCRILPVKVFNRNAVGLTSWVANGIIWAALTGARVINMSFGGADVEVNQTLELAIRYAFARGAVLVAAAGNNGTAGVWYPAAYDDYVLAASATDQNDDFVTRASSGIFGSNWGPEVDVAAPGLHVLSTWGQGLSLRGKPGWNGYCYAWGTSMSTAFVSGLAALLVSFRPDLTNMEIMSVIRDSADDLNASTFPGRDDYLGCGRINVRQALLLAADIEYPKRKKGRSIR